MIRLTTLSVAEYKIMQHGWWMSEIRASVEHNYDAHKGKSEYPEQNLPQCHCVHHKFHLDFLGSNPVLLSERPQIYEVLVLNLDAGVGYSEWDVSSFVVVVIYAAECRDGISG